MSEQEFAEWLCREMPAGTVIGDPKWWVPRIFRLIDQSAEIERLRAELAAIKGQEPVAWRSMSIQQPIDTARAFFDLPLGAPLYALPVANKDAARVSVTEEMLQEWIGATQICLEIDEGEARIAFTEAVAIFNAAMAKGE